MNVIGPDRKRFSMIRQFQLADWFTLGNAIAGSGMGWELDSLADIISFGVAPAMIAYSVGARPLRPDLSNLFHRLRSLPSRSLQRDGGGDLCGHGQGGVL
jgi:hypothetical protein